MKLAAAGFAMYFGAMRAMALQPAAIAPTNFVWNTMWVLAAGATLLGFVSDSTQDHALGNGHLLLIASSVISSARRPPLALAGVASFAMCLWKCLRGGFAGRQGAAGLVKESLGHEGDHTPDDGTC